MVVVCVCLVLLKDRSIRCAACCLRLVMVRMAAVPLPITPLMASLLFALQVCLKYVVLANMLALSDINPFAAREAKV